MCLLSPILFVCKDITFFQNRKNNVMKITSVHENKLTFSKLTN